MIHTGRGFSFTAAAEREIVWHVIEKRYYIGFNHGTAPKSTAEIDKEKTCTLPNKTIITVAPNVSVSQKSCSSQISLVEEPADSTTFLPGRSVTLTVARICTPMSCRQVAHPLSKHDKGTDGVDSILDEGQGGCSTRVKVLGPSSFQQVWTSKGGFNESGPSIVRRRCLCVLYGD